MLQLLSIDGTTYAMNSNGKTVDSFQAYPPSEPMRWAVDPESARQEAARGSLLAIAHLAKLGVGAGTDGLLPTAPMGTLLDNRVKHMVDRFLAWRLPENFSPDGGISFKKTWGQPGHERKHEPSGTNLLDATQAEAMVRYMVDGMSTATSIGALDKREVLPEGYAAPLDARTIPELIGERVRAATT